MKTATEISFTDIIKSSRFPLICLVVFAHSLGFDFAQVNFGDFSGDNLYKFTSQLISHNYTKIAVCLFFFFSGYLFFLKSEDFGRAWVLKKWKNRVHTLLIPFVCWNLMTILAVTVKNLAFGALGHYSAEEMDIVTNGRVWEWFTLPADFPLWFMKDLMCMVLMSPIIFLLVKKAHHFALAALLLLYASPLNPSFITMRGIFFFCTGAYFAIWKTDILSLCRKVRIPCHILAAATLLLATFNNSSGYHEWYLRLFYPFGMISFLNIIYWASGRFDGAQSSLQALSVHVFFIYAAHEIYILGWTKGLCLRIFGESLPAQFIRFFLVPIIVIFACILLHNILKKIAPKSLAFVCGNR